MPDFKDGDPIEVIHLKQYAGEAYYGQAKPDGTASAYNVDLTPPPLSGYPLGTVVNFQANVDNEANPTLNVNGLGAQSIVKNGNTPLAAADIKSGQVISVVFDGSNFQLLSVSSAGSEGPMGPTGPAGPPGATGPDGPAGATGPQGPVGADGATGPQGATGPAGPQGTAGPIGSVMPYVGSTAPPQWLMCYGQNVSRDTYWELSKLLSEATPSYPFGQGDGSNTFTLPDLRGRVVAGTDNMGGISAGQLVNVMNGGTLGTPGGAEQHTLIPSEIPDHAHGINIYSTGGGGAPVIQGGYAFNNFSTVSTNNNSGGGAHPNVQPTLVLTYIIYAGV